MYLSQASCCCNVSITPIASWHRHGLGCWGYWPYGSNTEERLRLWEGFDWYRQPTGNCCNSCLMAIVPQLPIPLPVTWRPPRRCIHYHFFFPLVSHPGQSFSRTCPGIWKSKSRDTFSSYLGKAWPWPSCGVSTNSLILKQSLFCV